MSLNYLPEIALVWLMLSAWGIESIRNHFKVETRKLIVLIGSLFSSIIAFLFFESIFFILVLIGILTWFIVKRKDITIINYHFIKLFISSIAYFSLALILTLSFQYKPQEINEMIHFFTISLLLMLIGNSVCHLRSMHLHVNERKFWREWRSLNAFIWCGSGLLAILLILPSMIAGFILSTLRTVLFWILSPFTWILKILPEKAPPPQKNLVA